ncbi:putative F-box protein At1g58310 [Silene latifolia]|uniref:putative F-box protein At1g58310 n=1 Tax=Silene latifolia TaxID=37657 RepID=UPI003D770D85
MSGQKYKGSEVGLQLFPACSGIGNISIKLTLDAGIGEVLDQLEYSSVHFNLPRLVYLKYSESLPKQYVISNLNSVVHAHFEVGYDENELDERELCKPMLDVIKGVTNCEILFLSGLSLQALTTGDFALPVFKNLTRLKLGQRYIADWNSLLLNFLNNSPRLESLTLMQRNYGRRTDDDELDDDCLLGDQPVPSCVSSCLKVINVKNFSCLRGQTDRVVYSLEKANALEQMIIHCRQRNSEREDEILKFPKASKICSISFKDRK